MAILFDEPECAQFLSYVSGDHVRLLSAVLLFVALLPYICISSGYFGTPSREVGIVYSVIIGIPILIFILYLFPKE